MKKAVILLSGGLDSATTLALAKEAGYNCYALSFRYGQRHAIELEAARKVAISIGVREHKIIEIDLRAFGGSALTGDIAVPKSRSAKEISVGIPITYVPARNTIFLSFALAWAEVIGAHDIFIGVNALDYSGYPDCRPEFIAAYEKMANLAIAATAQPSPEGTSGTLGEGVRQAIRIHTPIIHMNKAEIIREGVRLNVHYSVTISCYDPTNEGKPCGQCDSCLLRAKGFAENNMKDPAHGRAEHQSNH
jgi:7-cyano-7-deazaguanine synthase